MVLFFSCFYCFALKNVFLQIAIHGGQRRRRLEDSHDLRAHLLHLSGDFGVRHPPHPGQLHLHVDGAASLFLRPFQDGRRRGYHPVHSHVSPSVPHCSRHAAA